MRREASEALFEKSKSLFPGGVNSPVRAFRAVGGSPLFIEKGEGAEITDADGNTFLDFCCSYGPLILGHAPEEVKNAVQDACERGTTFGAPTKLENELAELIISNHRFLEKIRFVNSGTEATMSAIRLARGYTGRDKVIKFEGCYHGHADGLLVEAGSGLATLGTSSSAGVPENYAKETIVLPLHDDDAVRKAVEKYKGEIACIIIEPIPANNGLLLQGKEYLSFLREICDQEGILLFFDEVISGFRVGFEGAAGYYGVKPDLLAFGKIIGGGLPVGAYGASSEIMGHIAPDGPVYQAGTLSGNPVAMAAGIAQIKACLKEGFYDELSEKTEYFVDAVNAYSKSKGFAFKVFRVGSIFWLSFSEKAVVNRSSDISPEGMHLFKTLHHELLDQGIYLGPSGYEVGFISRAHSKDQLKKAIEAFKTSLDKTFSS